MCLGMWYQSFNNLFFDVHESGDGGGGGGDGDGSAVRVSDVDVSSSSLKLPSLLISMKFVSIGDPAVGVGEAR